MNDSHKNGLTVDWENVTRLMMISRQMDEFEESILAPTGKVAYQFSAKGHELAQILLALFLDHPHDGATVYYRSRPFMLASGLTVGEAFAAGMALTGSPSEGRDVGVMFSLHARSGATVLPTSGDVGAQYTPAAGWAQAVRYYQEELSDTSWEGALAVALGGDGSIAANGFWSALTIATTLELPMLFFIEDNRVGLSVPSKLQTPGGNIARNLESFTGLKVLEGSGTSPEEAAGLISQAVGHIRSGNGPVLIRLEVVRLTGHTFGEDHSVYKSSKEIQNERQQDPYLRLRAYMGGRVDWDRMEEEVKEFLREEFKSVEQNPEPDPGDVLKYVFHPGRKTEPLSDGQVSTETIDGESGSMGPRINFSESLRNVIDKELEDNEKLLVFGEDVGPRGGVHRVTVGLQTKYGERRVFDTSLSEEGIIGRSIGLAIAGLRPLAEIQFRKYLDPAMEPINDLGWLRWRTAGKFGAPVVVRIPVGHSKKTGDPWHSVSGESIFAHTLGWKVAYPSNAADAAGLLRTALRGEDPTFFLEHRALLDASESRRPYPGDKYELQFGKAKKLTEGNALTLIAWGEMVYRCMEAARDFTKLVEVIDLRTIIPWDKERVLDSVSKTGKCLVVHEDTFTGGFAGEILATVSDEAFIHLDGPPRRLTTIDTPIPYNQRMMREAVIPSVEKIKASIEKLLAY